MAKKRAMPPALAMVKDVFERIGLEPIMLDGNTGFHVAFPDAREVHGFAHVLPDDARFVLYLEFVDRVAKPRRAAVAEFLTRANYGMVLGNFEIDLDAGGVRFKTSLDYDEAPFEPAHVRNMLLAAMSAVGAFAEGLAAVAAGKKSPAAALAEAGA